MNDKDIDKALNQLLEQSIPEGDIDSRQESVSAALSAFKEEYAIEKEHAEQETSVISQGIESAARPNGNRDTNHFGRWLSATTESIRSFFMNTLNNRVAYSALGTVAIAFVAVSLVFVMPSMRTKTSVDDLVRNNQGLTNETTAIVTKIEPVEDNKSELVVTLPSQAERVENDEVVGNVTKFREQTPIPVPAQATEPLLSSIKKQDDGDSTSGATATGRRPVSKDALLEAKPRLRAESGQQRTLLADGNSYTTSKEKRVKASGAKPGRAEGESLHTAPKALGRKASSPPSMTIRPPMTNADLAAPGPTLDDREEYAEYQSNPVKLVQQEPVSTFSVDVDTASYSLVRNQLNNGYLPKPQAVRVEEFINYFDYDYPTPKSKRQPFASSISVFDSPWNKGKKLIHIGIKGYDIAKDETPDSNLVFLLDVSGSMNSANKLPLVKQSIGLLLETLKPSDTISIVVYAGAAGTVLEPTKVSEKQKIYTALQNLSAGGSTAGGAGIQLAYNLAEKNFDEEAVNRIILATDGDFNVGASSNEDLKTLVERKRKSGVFLSVLGFGRNNYQDDMMQTLAQNGNGVAAFIDSLSEAKKVLVDQATSSLFTIAKDVKLQVEFNPAAVSEYRLVGYETRHLNREDFNNDKVDAGDIGAGHTVTAIYEITPTGSSAASIDKPRYAQNTISKSKEAKSNEYGFLKIRYKLPNENKSKLIEAAISKGESKARSEAQFSIAVAGFAQLLSGSNHTGDLSFDDVIEAANQAKSNDPFGYRAEFIQLVRMAKIAK